MCLQLVDSFGRVEIHSDAKPACLAVEKRGCASQSNLVTTLIVHSHKLCGFPHVPCRPTTTCIRGTCTAVITAVTGC